ncbi:hypothetical protein [Nocardia veterana]|uniref:DUF8017 domain-containing protein n=1 Tax=Nocardia veterana TaxID=132249 RepID=A0A7X6LY80_9NOCA|nr:hypothetical protein [Nocardia veterana]NKY86371.1 hypothetical protein [Nocardia veterana]
MKQILTRLRRAGILAPLGKITLSIGGLVVFLYAVAWVGNPFATDVPDAKSAASAWLPTPVAPLSAAAEPPPGFPVMHFPPTMASAPPGQPQSVPTKFGLSYTVPNGNGWRPSNTMISGWSDAEGRIATYGAVSDYGYGYCPDAEGSALAQVGMTGRNGVDPETAAREEVRKAERIFADSGSPPRVTIAGPVTTAVDGRPAVRYTATITDIPRKHSCDPGRAEFDVVATPGYATAEVALLVVEHHTDLPHSLTKDRVEQVISSFRKTE